MSLTRRFRRRLQRKRSAAKKHRKVHLESLEPRILLSNDPSPLSFTAAAGSAVDLTLRLQEIDGTDYFQLIDTANQSVLQSKALADTSAVEIVGSDLDDTLRVEADFDAIPGSIPVAFHGGTGSDTIMGPDADSDWHITGKDQGRIAGLDFFDVENLSGAADNEDTFILHEGAGLSGFLEGGDSGFDTLVIGQGTYGTITFGPTGPDSGWVDLDGNVVTYRGLEPIDLSSSDVDNIRIQGTSESENFVLEPFNGRLKLSETSNSIETHFFDIPFTSISIDLGNGDDSITINGIMDLGTADLSIKAEAITVDNAEIKTTGDITLSAADSFTPNPYLGPIAELIAKADASVTIANATLDAANIKLSATSIVEVDSTGFMDGSAGVDGAVTTAFSEAFVSIEGDSQIRADSLTLIAASTADVTVEADSDASRGLAGSLAVAVVDSSAVARITGNTDLDVSGPISLDSANDVDVTVTADGEADGNAAGASVAFALVLDTTEAYIAGTVTTLTTPTGISLTARSAKDVATTARATAGVTPRAVLGRLAPMLP